MRRSLTTLLIAPALALVPQAAHAIPAWARRYNVNCSHCHYPAVPRLNATGLAFKWAGYRLPEEINEKVSVEKIENYMAAVVSAQYNYVKTSGQPASTNSFSVPSANVFAAGPFGKNFGGFLQLEREDDGSVGATVQFVSAWGNEHNWGGLRFAQNLLQTEGMVAGFDRPIGVQDIIPLTSPTTSGVPFAFGDDQDGIEGYYVFAARDRLSLQVVNGMSGDFATSSPKLNWVLTNQLMWDDAGSGLTVVGYYGTVAGLDETESALDSHYYRIGVSANKIYQDFEVLGGYIWSRDTDLPLSETSPFTQATINGTSYWFSGQYLFAQIPLTVFGRYEYLRPNNSESDVSQRRVSFGGVLPINNPANLRLALEYSHDMPRPSTEPKTNSVAMELLIAF